MGKYFPYGQERPSATTDGKEKFATYFRDSETGLDYADQRYHQPGMGRFMTPDSYSGSASANDPGSWNRYAYSGGDPVNFNDKSGLFMQAVSGGEESTSGGDICSMSLDMFNATFGMGWSAYYYNLCGGGLSAGEQGQGAGTGGGSGGGGAGSGSSPMLAGLVAQSRDRVENILKDKGEGCALAIGAGGDVDAALARLGGTPIMMSSDITGSPAGINLGPWTLDANGSAQGYYGGFYNGAITINSNIDWASGTTSVCNAAGCTTFDVTKNVGGVGSVSPAQLMDFMLLHELAHSFGLSHGLPDGASQDFYNEAIWQSCFQ